MTAHPYRSNVVEFPGETIYAVGPWCYCVSCILGCPCPSEDVFGGGGCQERRRVYLEPRKPWWKFWARRRWRWQLRSEVKP